MKIGIFEDEPAIQLLVRHYIEAAGHEVGAVVPSRKEADRLLAERSPEILGLDCVVLDGNFSGTSEGGRDALEVGVELREQRRLLGEKTILLLYSSGVGDSPIQTDVFDAQFGKPTGTQALIDYLKKLSKPDQAA